MTKSYWLKKISIPNADLFLEYIRTVLPWIKSVGGVVVKRDLISLYYINEKRIGVKFTHAGVIGPKFGRKNIKAMKEINNEQLGWLEITYLSNKLRICRGDKGTLFVLRKINSPTLFKNFKEFIKIY